MWQRLLSAACISLFLLGLTLYAFILWHTAKNGQLFVSLKPLEPVSDYLFWYAGGTVANSPQRHHLYELATLLPVWNSLIAPAHLDVAPAYVHPPYFALLFIPFAILPITTSYIIWTVAWLIFGWISLILILKSRKTFSTGEIIAFLIVTTVLPPSLACIRIGQLSWLILALLGLFYYCFEQRRHILAGVCMAFLSIKPHYFLFFVLPAFIDRRWKTLAAFAVVESVFMVASGVILGWHNVFGYPSILMNRDATAPAVAPHRMISVRVFFNLFLESHAAQTASMVAMVIAWGLVIYVWYRTLKSKPQLSNWAMTLTVLACIVTSPHTHMYDAMLIAIPAAITLSTANLFKALSIKPWPVRLWNCTLLGYAIASTFAFFLFPGRFIQDLCPAFFFVHLLLLAGAAFAFVSQLRGTVWSSSTECDQPQTASSE